MTPALLESYATPRQPVLGSERVAGQLTSTASGHDTITGQWELAPTSSC